jgi:hypothetical protein
MDKLPHLRLQPGSALVVESLDTVLVVGQLLYFHIFPHCLIRLD